jgi:hypothetical protein
MGYEIIFISMELEWHYTVNKSYLSVCMFHKVISALFRINHIPCTDVEFPTGELIAKQARKEH